jgi:hypothetical protein
MSDTATVTCPVCGDYDGEVSSVKGHITASGGDHEGRSGEQYDDLLKERASGADEEPDGGPNPAPDDGGREKDRDESELAVGPDEPDGATDAEVREAVEDPEVDDPVDEELPEKDAGTYDALWDEDDERTDPKGGDSDDSDEDGIPTGWAVVGMGVVLIVLLLVFAESDSGGSQPTETVEEPNEGSVDPADVDVVSDSEVLGA